MTGVEYAYKPQQYEIIRNGNTSFIILRENIEKKDREDCEIWKCDEYSLKMQWRRGIYSDVEENFTVWLEKAKAADNTAKLIQEQKKYEHEVNTKLVDILLDYDFRLMMLEELGGDINGI